MTLIQPWKESLKVTLQVLNNTVIRILYSLWNEWRLCDISLYFWKMLVHLSSELHTVTFRYLTVNKAELILLLKRFIASHCQQTLNYSYNHRAQNTPFPVLFFFFFFIFHNLHDIKKSLHWLVGCFLRKILQISNLKIQYKWYHSHWNNFSPMPVQPHLQSYLPSCKLIPADKTQWSWKTDFSKKTPFQTLFSHKNQ